MASKLNELMALARECGNIERRHCIGKAQGFDVRNAYAELESALKAVVEDAERYQWIKSQKGLDLRSEREHCVWTREDGSKFNATHYLAAGGMQYGAHDSLDATIDAARKP